MADPTVVSLFSGAGGLDIGLEQAGFCTILANEIEPYACESLRLNQSLCTVTDADFESWFSSQILSQRCYIGLSKKERVKLHHRLRLGRRLQKDVITKAHIIERDVRLLSAAEILARTGKTKGQVDLVAGGAPCQPFSRAGKRELVDCDTGQLFMEFVRIVDGVRPRWFLFENVKGLVIHKADVATLRCPKCRCSTIGPFLSRALLRDVDFHNATCEKCGYLGSHTVVWNNQRSGSRDIIEAEFERLGYTCTSCVLNAADYGAPQQRERLFIIGSRDGERVCWPSPTHGEDVKTSQKGLFDSSPLSSWRTMTDTLFKAGHWKYGHLDPHKAVLWVKNVVRPHDEPVTWGLNRPSPTIGAHQSAKLAIAPFGVPDARLSRQQWHVLGRRQGDTAPVFVEHEYLTDDELLALQTFPSSWYLHGTRMQRAFQIGNAVPPALARVVGSIIASAMNIPVRTQPSEKLYHVEHAARV